MALYHGTSRMGAAESPRTSSEQGETAPPFPVLLRVPCYVVDHEAPSYPKEETPAKVEKKSRPRVSKQRRAPISLPRIGPITQIGIALLAGFAMLASFSNLRFHLPNWPKPVAVETETVVDKTESPAPIEVVAEKRAVVSQGAQHEVEPQTPNETVKVKRELGSHGAKLDEELQTPTKTAYLNGTEPADDEEGPTLEAPKPTPAPTAIKISAIQAPALLDPNIIPIEDGEEP